MWRPAARLRRAVPHLPRLAAAACPRARSRPGSRPGSRTARGSGSGARARAGENGGPAGDLFVTVKVSPHARLRPQGRQPHARRPGVVRRGGPRRRDQDPDPRRRRGHAQDPGRHAQRAHVPGPRQGGDTAPTAPRATCSRPCRCRSPARSTRPPARPSRPTAPPTPASRCGPTCSRTVRRERLQAPGPEAAVYVISVAAELSGPAPADAAGLRADGPDHARPYRRRRPPLLPPRHRAAPVDRRADGVRRRRRGRTPTAGPGEPDRGAARPQRRAGRRARGHPGGAPAGAWTSRPAADRLPAVRAPEPGQSVVVWRRRS